MANKYRKGTLAAVLGSAAAAVALFISIPAEESGRIVAATAAADGTIALRHISGRQYLTAYLDDVGVATVCDGITAGVKMGQRRTETQCTALLEHELVAHAEKVIACVPQLYGRPNQAAAAVSLAYNIGWPAFCSSTAARMFRAGRWREGCEAFAMWNKGTVGGRKVVLAGLVKRRGREAARCLTQLPA